MGTCPVMSRSVALQQYIDHDNFPARKSLTDNWDELEHLFEEESLREDRKAPKLYARLHELNGW